MRWRSTPTGHTGRSARRAVARSLAAVPLVLLPAACNGDDDAAPPTSAAITSPPAPTSAPAVPTTDAPVSSTTAAPTLPAEIPATTDPPTDTTSPTIPELTPDEQAVVDAVVAAWTAWNDVLLDPNDDARVEEIARTHTGEALQRVVQVVALRRDENRRSVINEALPAYIDPDESSVIVDPQAGTAEVEYCHLDSNVAVITGGNADGTDQIVDDSIAIRFERETFELVDGRWLKAGGFSLGAMEDETECPA